MGNLKAITFAVRQALASRGVSVSNGHVQQMLAAGLGHNNLASYQASGDDARLPDAEDIVVDYPHLSARASDLDCAVDADDLVFAEFYKVLKQRFPRCRVHRSQDAFVSDLQQYVDRLLPDDDAVNSEVAMTNGWMPTSEVELPLWDDGFTLDGTDDLTEQLEGLVVVEQDPERVFYGTEIEVTALIWVKRLGRRLFGPRSLDVERAQLRWQNLSLEDYEREAEAEAEGVRDGVEGAPRPLRPM